MSAPKRFPEVNDFVAVTERQVEYYGFIDAIDYDLRGPRVCVEFFADHRRWFDLTEIKLMQFPEAAKE